MPRIHCPKNPDCYVDCPGSGYAFYVEPYGPCEKGCVQERAGDELRRLFERSGKLGPFSGTVIGITTGVLANFAADIINSKLSSAISPQSTEDLATLQRIAVIRADRRINATWHDVDMNGVIRALTHSAAGDETSGKAQAA